MNPFELNSKERVFGYLYGKPVTCKETWDRAFAEEQDRLAQRKASEQTITGRTPSVPDWQWLRAEKRVGLTRTQKDAIEKASRQIEGAFGWDVDAIKIQLTALAEYCAADVEQTSRFTRPAPDSAKDWTFAGCDWASIEERTLRHGMTPGEFRRLYLCDFEPDPEHKPNPYEREANNPPSNNPFIRKYIA